LALGRACGLWRWGKTRKVFLRKLAFLMPTSTSASRSAQHALTLVFVDFSLANADPSPFWQVAVLRTSGRRTVARVAATWPGWVRVDVGPGASKDVPEGSVCRLLGGLRLDWQRSTTCAVLNKAAPLCGIFVSAEHRGRE
jgi:hypothetical protein